MDVVSVVVVGGVIYSFQGFLLFQINLSFSVRSVNRYKGMTAHMENRNKLFVSG